MERRQEVRNGLKDGIAIGMGYFSVSFAFGMQAVSVGISPWIAALMSLTNMTSAGQFASADRAKRFADRISLDPACHQFALCADVAFFITEIRSGGNDKRSVDHRICQY